MKLIDDLKAYFNQKNQRIAAQAITISQQAREIRELERAHKADNAAVDALVEENSELRAERNSLELEKAAAQKMIDLAAEEMVGSRKMIDDFRLAVSTLAHKNDLTSRENDALRESLKLIETTHGEDLDVSYKLCKQAEQLRVIAFDVAAHCVKLTAELKLYKGKADGDDTAAEN
jgi:ribosomal protein L16 Arg81 hydroxylase